MKTKTSVFVVFDRRKRVNVTCEGRVEICIYLNRNTRKFVGVRNCTLFAWKKFEKSEELKNLVEMYENVLNLMIRRNEPLTLDVLNHYLGEDIDLNEHNLSDRFMKSPTGFIDFLKYSISKEKFSAGTLGRKKVVVDAVIRFGKLNSFSALIPRRIKEFDEFLREETSRSSVTLNNYHKELRKYVNLAYQYEYIDKNPYESPLCHFERGKSRERKPLNEDELLELRSLSLSSTEDNVRDLFVFCAYTGLSYIDSQMFDYSTMTEKINGQTYIDGRRVKTGNNYFTPILPPAMEVLKKHKYRLPHISNQKSNLFLHVIESRMKLNKPMTMHVARHSFATLLLSYDIPIENVARMLGHSDIKTTLIYAKILKSTIDRHTEMLSKNLR